MSNRKARTRRRWREDPVLDTLARLGATFKTQRLEANGPLWPHRYPDAWYAGAAGGGAMLRTQVAAALLAPPVRDVEYGTGLVEAFLMGKKRPAINGGPSTIELRTLMGACPPVRQGEEFTIASKHWLAHYKHALPAQGGDEGEE